MRNVPETPWYLEMFQVRQKTTKKSKDSELSKTRPIRSESRDALKKFSYLDLKFLLKSFVTIQIICGVGNLTSCILNVLIL